MSHKAAVVIHPETLRRNSSCGITEGRRELKGAMRRDIVEASGTGVAPVTFEIVGLPHPSPGEVNRHREGSRPGADSVAARFRQTGFSMILGDLPGICFVALITLHLGAVL